MKTIEYFEELDKKLDDRKYLRSHVGEYVAVKNYRESIRMGADDFEVSDPPYNEEDTVLFLETLKAAGVTDFCYIAKTTLTIDFLYICNNNGFYISGIGTVHRNNDIFGEEEIKGIWVGC